MPVWDKNNWAKSITSEVNDKEECRFVDDPQAIREKGGSFSRRPEEIKNLEWTKEKIMALKAQGRRRYHFKHKYTNG